MFLEELLKFAPVWDKPDEGAGGGDKDTSDTDGDDGADDGDDTGIADADDQDGGNDGEGGDTDDDGVALDGGTAEGQDNSGEGDDDGDESDGDDEDDPDVPETYDYSDVELPEGMQLDEAMVEAAEPVFRELGLSQDQANKLVSMYADQMQGQAEASAEAAKQLVSGWLTTAKADKEIGLNNWKGSVGAANAVIRKFGTPELVSEVMVGQGIGNHPEMVRLLSRIGAAMGDDKLITGDNTDTGGDTPAEEVWYGSTTPKSKKG